MTAVICKLAAGEGYGAARPKTYVPGPLFQSRRDKTFVTAFMKDAARYGIQDGVDLRRSAYEEDLRQLLSTPENELTPDRLAERDELIAEIKREIQNLHPSHFPNGQSHQLVPAPQNDAPPPPKETPKEKDPEEKDCEEMSSQDPPPAAAPSEAPSGAAASAAPASEEELPSPPPTANGGEAAAPASCSAPAKETAADADIPSTSAGSSIL